ncbi:hypothetical protein KMZ93_01185 [Bradyrhizobium sediminis]|uniref:Uncharacterized protein n=1 Tax=Bradyrhizobium sediminis TaxID=2840469 RepID=A0A975RY25_9BRAD|nr:hypothetical protein [Bradyrhizobium sediminis]QWG23596.1 hypothetical protein KMZ93_01185 [Bradyrhizobium sediminis]
MGDNLVPNEVVEGLQGFLLQLEVSQIVVHEADESNAIVTLLDAEFLVETLILLRGKAKAATGGDKNLGDDACPMNATHEHASRRDGICRNAARPDAGSLYPTKFPLKFILA